MNPRMFFLVVIEDASGSYEAAVTINPNEVPERMLLCCNEPDVRECWQHEIGLPDGERVIHVRGLTFHFNGRSTCKTQKEGGEE